MASRSGLSKSELARSTAEQIKQAASDAGRADGSIVKSQKLQLTVDKLLATGKYAASIEESKLTGKPVVQYAARGMQITPGDAARHRGEPSVTIKVTPPCGHVHHALFRKSSGDCVLNLASAMRAGSEACDACVVPGRVRDQLKPRLSWNSKLGWKVESMPYDDEDEAEFSVPPGFQVASAPPPADQLEFRNPEGTKMIDRRILFCWPDVGWCEGKIVAVNTDARHRVGDNKVNFFIYYEVDDDTSKHHLSASNYGRENEWVLLDPLAAQ